MVVTTLRAEQSANGWTIGEGDRPIVSYLTKSSRDSSRIHYFHPLLAPDGTRLTQDGPDDHVHHRGCFWAWRRILSNGDVIADSWVMKNLTYRIAATRFDVEDGAGVFRVGLDWMLQNGGPARAIVSEITTLRVWPLAADQVQRLQFDIALAAREDGLSLAGSDDDKGYGGFSVRLVDPERLAFASQGTAIVAAHRPVEAEGPLVFRWDREGPRWTVSLQCRLNDSPLRSWILRRGGSMQNSVFPGRTPFPLVRGKILRLSAALEIAPAELRR